MKIIPCLSLVFDRPHRPQGEGKYKMRTYEIMYVVRPNIEEDAKKQLLNASTVS